MERAREELMRAIVFSKPTMSVLAMTGTVFDSSKKKTKATNRNAGSETGHIVGETMEIIILSSVSFET